MPKAATINQQKLIDLLCTPMTASARAEALGVARSAYYAVLDRLTQNGILRQEGYLNPGMTFNGAHPRSRYSGTHHAAVQHVRWADAVGRWEVQGALLDEWDNLPGHDTSVTVRWSCPDAHYASFPIRPVTLWSTRDTRLNIRWGLSPSVIENLTVAIARVIHTRALIIPSENDNVDNS